ncbi:iso-1-cytochrome c [Phytophthora boehmeriae]|uniref:Iso-1-cytochrome c n=1 Tax=Phytophthora boehmeriae TaxID=109152 RepID=A0A8T1X1B4_9STRA|nr:iso-1-cytochrome c [Phytophthora boehmeriae]
MMNRAKLLQRAAKVGAGALLGGSVVTGVTAFSSDQIEALHYGFDHQGPLSSFDYASVRRGYQVYREVCASCHSLDRICFRNLVGVTHTEAELKEMAADIDVIDGPNDEGEMFDRPGKLSDPLPRPYANDEAAAAANNGAIPPDLSLITKARHAGPDYLFALLTGYVDPPEGTELLPGLYYNPYFGGGAIAMERQLQDGQIEYEDGTPCTTSQMAKDVSVFLAWAAEPEHDERKKMGMQVTIALLAMCALTGYYKRLKWSPLKTRKITYTK